VHNERCTPGSGAGVGETTAGDRGIGAPAPCSLTKPTRRPSDPLGALERLWERYHGSAEALVKQSVAEEDRSKVAAAIRGHAQVLDNLRETVA
jgi:hypothetical protein